MTVRPRTNQQLRTRAALLQAAGKLLSEGQQPSMAAVAKEALVSTATAYRYFASAEVLWTEAAHELALDHDWDAETLRQVEAAGADVAARADIAVRRTMAHALEKPLIFRRNALAAQQQWFAQQADPDPGDAPVRAGRRNRVIKAVVQPLRDQGQDAAADRLAAALAVLIGVEPMVSLVDAARLDPDQVMDVIADMTRWMMTSALPELT